MIDKLHEHFSFTTPASIHDEEALTALELAGRTAKKVNEIVDDQNALRSETSERLSEQDEEISKIKAETISEQQIIDVQNDIHAYAFVGDGNTLRWEENGMVAGSLSLYLPYTLKFRRQGNAGSLPLSADYFETGSKDCLFDYGEGVVVRINPYTTLVLNDNLGFGLRENSQMKDGDVPLAVNTFNEFVGGCLIDQYVNATLQSRKTNYYAYLGSGVNMSVTPMANNEGYIVEIPCQLSVVADTIYTTPWVNGGADTVTVLDGGNALRCMLYNYDALYFDTVSKTVGVMSVRNNYTLKPSKISLIENRYMNLVGGCLFQEMNYKKIDDLSKHSVGFMGHDIFLEITERSGNDGYNVKFPCRISVIHDASVAVEWNTACVDISENITIDGNTATLFLPNHKAFVFNYIDGLFHLRSSGSIQYGDTVLIQNAWMNIVGGSLITEYLTKKLETVGEDVIEQHDKVKEFCEIVANSVDPSTFIFFTDPHVVVGEGWEQTFHDYVKVVKDVYETAPVDAVVCGGDWLNAHTKKDALSALGYIDAYMFKNFGDKYIPCVGNHDTNYQGVLNSWEDEVGSGEMSVGDFMRVYLRSQNYVVAEMDGYFSRKIYDTRFYILNSGLDGNPAITDGQREQLRLFENDLNGSACEKNVVIIHAPWDGSEGSEFKPLFMQEVERIVNDYNDGNPTYLCSLIIGGHLHRDKEEINPTYGVVATTNLQDGGVPSFDLVCVDHVGNWNYKITTKRIGTGVDRQFTVSK